MEKTQILENIQTVRNRMAEAEQQAGVPIGSTLLLAATKTVSAEDINFAVNEGGITDIGENRVQELLAKYDQLDKDKMRIHFIGTLQTNKVKYIIDKVDLIHSVDSLKLAKEIDRRAGAIGKVQDILLEYNSGGEENKSGFSEAICPFSVLSRFSLCKKEAQREKLTKEKRRWGGFRRLRAATKATRLGWAQAFEKA